MSARPVVGDGRPRSPPRWRRRRCRRRPAGCASRRRRSARGRSSDQAIDVGPSSWMPLSSYRTMSLPRRRWPARRAASEAMPSWRSPSLAMTYVRWSTIVPGRPVELGGQAALGDGHADRVREALAERSGRRLDAGRQAVLRVAGRARAPLPERLEVVQREVVAGQVEERVEEHRGVAGRQDEAVAIRPVRVGRRVAQEARPQRRRPSAPRPSGRPGGRSSPVGRRRSRGSGWCRWRGGRGRASRRSWVGTPVGAVGGRAWGAIVDREGAVSSASDADHPLPRPRAPSRRPTRAPSPASRRDRRPRRPDGRRRPGAGAPLGSGHGRARPGVAGPGRVGGHDRPLAGRLGARSSLVVRGRAGRGRSSARRRLREDGVMPRVMRVAGRADRADRRARHARWRALVRRRPRRRATSWRRTTCRPSWFARADAVHLPVYSLLGEPLGLAGRRAVTLAREAGAVVSVDLASIGAVAVARAAGGPRPHRRDRPGPAVRDGRRGGGAARPLPAARACSSSRRWPSSSAAARAPRSWPATATSGCASRSRREHVDGDRHDRGRRRVRCRVPRRLVRRPRGGPVAAGVAAARRPGRPSRRDPPALDPAAGAAARCLTGAVSRAGSGRTRRSMRSLRSIRRSGRPASRTRATRPGTGRTRRSGAAGAGR